MENGNARHSEYDIHPLFLKRWSPRAFAQEPVQDEALFAVLEAARWAPSASNEQPWRYIIARTAEEREAFYSFINPGNLKWCTAAPVLLLLISAKLTSRGNPNRTYAFDAGTSWGYLALQAAEKGMITHAMGGFDPDKARQLLGIPDDYELYAVVALGYRGDLHTLPEDLQEREKASDRRPLKESLFAGRFGKPIM